MKTPKINEVIAVLRRSGFTMRDEKSPGIWNLARGARSRIRVSVEDEDMPGEYLRTIIMVETANGSFEEVATLTSFATLGMIEQTVRGVVMLDNTSL